MQLFFKRKKSVIAPVVAIILKTMEQYDDSRQELFNTHRKI